MKRKLISAALCATMVGSLLAGSAMTAFADEAADNGDIKIGVSIWSSTDVLGSQCKKILDEAAKALGVEVQYVDQGHVSEQVTASVDQLIVYKRNRLSFICFSQFLREYVHAATPLRRWCISCLYREYHNHCEKAMPFSELSLRHASCRTAEFIWKETSEILASCGMAMV